MRKFRLVAGLGRQPTQQQQQQQQQQREVGITANGNGVSVANGPETAASLLAAGLDARAAELASATPLQRAAAEGHVDIVHQLLKHGADVNHQDSLHGNSALHEAAWRGYSQTVTVLSQHKANVNAVNRAGFTPLHLCCQNGHNETCRVLLWADANPDAKNHYGDTPLHTSGRYGHAGVMRILVSAQCNVSEQNKNGDTALHIAAAMGRRKLTRILIAAGCSTNVKNKQGEYAVDIARRKEFHEIVSMLVKSPKASANGATRGTHAHDRSKSSSTKSKSKRLKPDSATASSKDGSRSNSSKPKERKRRKEKHGSAGESSKALNGHVVNSPYGCHDNPELAKLLHKKLNALPDRPLKKGEQYFLDLSGKIQKGPVGVPTCYCGPVLHRLECRLAKDKQEILHRLDSAHLRLDAKIDGLERNTQQQLQGLQRTVDSLGLESSAAGLQRVRNSIVIDDPGHSTPPLPNCLELVSDSATSHSLRDSDDPAQPPQWNNQKTKASKKKPADTAPDQVQQPAPHEAGNEVQYTMDRLGLDSGVQEASTNKQQALQALKNRLALTRIQEQLELDAIVEHYQRRNHGHYNGNGNVAEDAEEDEEEDDENEGEEEESEESEDEDIILPPPAIISSEKASMLSDSRYENYDYPASITKPLPSYVMAGQEPPHQPTGVANGSGVLTYRNLPLPRYHLDTTTAGSSGTSETTPIQMFNGVTATTTVVDIHQANQADHPANNLLGVIIDPVLYARHFAGHNHHDLRVYHDDQDRHNDSGYSTRPGESSQGPSPSLSGPAESTEGDNTATLSPRSTRRMENFQSHFARDLAQTLPAMTNGSSTNGYYHHQNGKNGVVAYPRVRFAVPDHEQSHFPPGTISSSSLV